MADSPAAEVTLREPEVRMLLAHGAPELAQLPLTLLSEGWDNAMWRLGDEFAVRIPRRARSAPLIEHEQRALPVLAPRLRAVGIRTPVPLIAGRPVGDFPWSWSVVPWIQGDHAIDRPRSANTSWAADLARAVQALHEVAPADAPLNPVRGVPLRHRDDRIRTLLAAVPPHLEPALRHAWDAGLAASASAERVWIHGDLHPGNIIIDSDRLTALIDFGDVTAGDPAYDLAAAWMSFDADGRETFRKSTGSRYDGDTWTRARAWAAALACILLTQSDDRPDFLALGHSTAQELARD